MVVVLLLLLLAPGAPGQAEQAAALRVLVLPDVTLSAEDPLYLAVPAATGWILSAPEQPPLDRRRLWAVDAPPRVKSLQALPPLPDSAPRPARPEAVPAAPAVPGGGPGLPPGTASGETSPEEAWRASERGLRALFRGAVTAGLDLWLDRRAGPWQLEAGSALTLSAELPSSLALRAAAALQRPGWTGSVQAGGQGLLRSQDSGFLAGSLSAELRRVPAPFDLQAATRLRVEQPAEPDDCWLLASQELAGSWRGEQWGFRADGSAFAVMAQSPVLRGLARLGLEWAGDTFSLSAGGSFLASEDGSRLYPEAALELRPFASLRLLAGLAAYLEQPAPFLVRETFREEERVDLLPPAGLGLRLAAVLEGAGNGSLGVGLQAFEGERLLPRNGLLYLETDPHLVAEILARLALNTEARQRPTITLAAGGTAAIRQPVSARTFSRPLYAGLNAGLRIGFAKRPAELILQARWGEVAATGLETALAERQAAGWAGWQASLEVRWAVRPLLAVEGGLEAGERLDGLAGLTLQARR